MIKQRIKSMLLAAMILALLLLPTSLARADNGPHGSYTALTDACAGCHRAHTAAAARLLIDSVPNLCYSCHGSIGTGADTNVVDGIYLERDPIDENPDEGVTARGLKGGGFTNATMDTNYDGTSAPAAVTSNHLSDGSMGIAWGNGAIGSGPGATIQLSCISCHDPHGKAGTGGVATYRLLRAIPTGSGAGGGVNVTDQNTKYYVVSDPDNQYYGENYATRTASLSNWCAQCHTRYSAGTGSGSTNSGDPIFTYRHMTTAAGSSGPACLNCHVAHGSAAMMGTYSGAVAWPDGAILPNGNQRSSLLRVDNRGVCELCHMK